MSRFFNQALPLVAAGLGIALSSSIEVSAETESNASSRKAHGESAFELTRSHRGQHRGERPQSYWLVSEGLAMQRSAARDSVGRNDVRHGPLGQSGGQAPVPEPGYELIGQERMGGALFWKYQNSAGDVYYLPVDP